MLKPDAKLKVSIVKDEGAGSLYVFRDSGPFLNSEKLGQCLAGTWTKWDRTFDFQQGIQI